MKRTKLLFKLLLSLGLMVFNLTAINAQSENALNNMKSEQLHQVSDDAQTKKRTLKRIEKTNGIQPTTAKVILKDPALMKRTTRSHEHQSVKEFSNVEQQNIHLLEVQLKEKALKRLITEQVQNRQN